VFNDASLHSTQDSSVDRDNDRRASARVPVEVEISLASDHQFFTGLTRDLSSGGVFVATYKCLPLGCTVVMHLTLPDGDLAARGTVRWHRESATDAPPGMGIAFDALDAEGWRRIERFCLERDPLFYDEG
jgi:uncharacterized protein (TIGR02266 family)